MSAQTLTKSKTKIERENAIILVAYWMRKLVSAEHMYAVDLMDIVLRYYPILDFKWDPMRTHSSIQLSDDNKTLKHTKDWNSAVAVSETELSSECMKTVSLEFTLNDVGLRGIDYLLFGYVDSMACDQVHLEDWLCMKRKPHEKGFCILARNFCKVYLSENTPFTTPLKGADCKDGDRVMLEFDFGQSKCTILFNDEEIGILPGTLPCDVHVVANVCSPAITLEVSKFEVSI